MAAAAKRAATRVALGAAAFCRLNSAAPGERFSFRRSEAVNDQK
jgi:hypothetical protein